MDGLRLVSEVGQARASMRVQSPSSTTATTNNDIIDDELTVGPLSPDSRAHFDRLLGQQHRRGGCCLITIVSTPLLATVKTTTTVIIIGGPRHLAQPHHGF